MGHEHELSSIGPCALRCARRPPHTSVARSATLSSTHVTCHQLLFRAQSCAIAGAQSCSLIVALDWRTTACSRECGGSARADSLSSCAGCLRRDGPSQRGARSWLWGRWSRYQRKHSCSKSFYHHLRCFCLFIVTQREHIDGNCDRGRWRRRRPWPSPSWCSGTNRCRA